jgi:hypothetical protein
MSQLGVHAVLNKIDDMTHLISAVHAVDAGASYVSASMQPHGKVTTTGKKDSLELTQREVEVIRLYVSGMSRNAIADQLHAPSKLSALRKSVLCDERLICYESLKSTASSWRRSAVRRTFEKALALCRNSVRSPLASHN